MLIKKILENNTIYSVQELCLSLFLTELHSVEFTPTSLVSSIFQNIHQLIYLLTFFCTHNCYSLSTHQRIYNIRTHTYSDSKEIIYHIHLYQLILCIHTCIYHHSNVVYSYKCLHLIYIYTIHAILCVLFH